MLTCKDTSRLISEAQERKLTFIEKVNLRIHILACASCRRFEQQIGFLRNALKGSFSEGQLPADKPLPDDSKERILKASKNNLVITPKPGLPRLVLTSVNKNKLVDFILITRIFPLFSLFNS